ncbi:MAG TPA: nucleoside/nucleotide kinase family protein [Acidimicrobiales bacterium]|nr:nucleoside/nucleotide kinase family protein [Acidimicrobiales bacterium]
MDQRAPRRRRREQAASGARASTAQLPAAASLADHAGLEARARALAARGDRQLLGITGAPGAGKSTLGDRLVEAVGPTAVLVSMDGFHLAQEELDRLGRALRKGAIDTFDGDGFLALLRRIREAAGEVVYAPRFRRDLEEPIAGAVPVRPEHALVVVEGNYLLDAAPSWSEVRKVLDEVWYLEPAEELRVERLVDRHLSFGLDRDAAIARALGSDQHNAERIRLGRSRADLVVR